MLPESLGSNLSLDEPLVWYEGAANTAKNWIYTNHLGSVVALANTTGASTATYTYGPYGEPNTTAGNMRFRYTGQQLLAPLNLYYYKARIYSPTLGRFLQTDPIGQQDDMNLYAYVKNNAMNSIDPTGLFERQLGSIGKDPAQMRLSDAELSEIDGQSRGPVLTVLLAAGTRMAYNAYKIDKKIEKSQADEIYATSSNAARKQVMREQNIPTSQQPGSQSKNASGREYTYEVPKSGGGSKKVSVQQQTMDRSHPGQDHWEAGPVKMADGQMRMGNYGRPALSNQKSKVNVNK